MLRLGNRRLQALLLKVRDNTTFSGIDSGVRDHTLSTIASSLVCSRHQSGRRADPLPTENQLAASLQLLPAQTGHTMPSGLHRDSAVLP